MEHEKTRLEGRVSEKRRLWAVLERQSGYLAKVHAQLAEVNIRCRQTGVAKLAADRGEVEPGRVQRTRMGVAEGMRMAIHARRRCEPAKHPPNVRGRQTRASLGGEDEFLAPRGPVGQPQLPVAVRRNEGNLATLTALAATHCDAVAVDIACP